MLASLLLLAQSPPPAEPHGVAQVAPDTRAIGSIVSAAGDQDFDGVPDFILGEPLPQWDRRNPAEPELRAWLISGRDGATLGSFDLHWTLRDDRCDDHAQCPVRDRLVLSAPIGGGEGCTLALVDGESGREIWHTPAYRGARGRLRAHLVPIPATATSDASTLDTALLCSLSCVSEALPFAWTSPGAKTHRSLGVLVIENRFTLERREFELLPSGEPAVSDVPAKGIRYRREREQIACAPEEWGGGSGDVAVLGDLDCDGFNEVGAGVPDRVRIDSGRSGELLAVVATDSKQDFLMGFGSSLANLGDINDDRVDDFVVSETETLFSGSVRALSGADRNVIWIACPPFEASADQFGQELAPVGDVDLDGVTDFIVGTKNMQACLPGYTALISGRTGKALREYHRDRSGVVSNVPNPRLSWMPLR